MLFVEGILKNEKGKRFGNNFLPSLFPAYTYRNSVEQMPVDLESTTLVKSRRSVNFGWKKKMASLFLLT